MVLLFTCLACDRAIDYGALFESLPSERTGITFRNIVPEDELTNSFVYEYVYNGGGVAVGDLNDDGLDDIYFTSNLGSNRLYLNLGDLEFKDITEKSKTKGKRGWTTGTNFVDINNDGLLDIYVCKSGPYDKAVLLENELYVNQGPDDDGIPVFEEAANRYGLNDTSHSIQSTFFDFDLDGDLDMYLMNHNPQTFGMGDTDTFSPLGDKFYVNESGKYIDRTTKVGIYSNAISYGLGIGVGDLNRDGWPDVYISNDYDERDYLYVNQKDGSFKEVVKAATNHISNFAMGNDIADFDNDGYMDILTLDMVSEDNYGMKTSMASMNPEKFNRNIRSGRHYQYMYNTFQRHSTHIDSTGVPFFSDVAQITGVSNTDWSWAPLMADFDNDGLKDIFITNGIKKDFRNKDFFKDMQQFREENPDALSNPEKITSLIARTPKRSHKNYFYKNKGDLNFENTSDVWLPDGEETYSNGAAYSDLDNDGDLDLVINNVDDMAMVLRNNQNISQNDYLQLKFEGPQKNTQGIGTKIILYTEKGKQVFENYTVRGYQSSVSPGIHIGLGKNVGIDSLIVVWPDHTREKIKPSEINTRTTVRYDKKTKKPVAQKRPEGEFFARNARNNRLRHIENEYDDYGVQLLLPHKMSQFGPAVAVADINADGLDDIYLGQSSGYASTLYIQDGKGEFSKHRSFDEDALYEDVDAKFFDFDNDGDLDLYVASGGNEFEAGSVNYADRLYENKDGEYIKRRQLLPSDIYESSSRIAVADYDQDGFLDLFVGGRHTPHQYPTGASSYILKNEKGIFKNVTKEKASGLINLGMVTDAAWTDYDLDGDLDVAVVGEWMAPTFFQNVDNSFRRMDHKPLDSLSGWYFSLRPLDVDGDGDDDYIIGNLGENYKYKATASEPFEMYYGDFDSNGKSDIVLGYYNFGDLFPVRGRECSSQQMPSIKKTIPTYDEFGKSTIDEIYGKNNLEDALHLVAYNFKSGILENKGNGKFDFQALPSLAQLSSLNDILVRDLNGDNRQDLIVAGNLFTSEIETPRNDAGYGMVLLHRDGFGFEPIPSAQSGLFLPKDVKNLNSISILGIPHLLVGNNDDTLGFVKLLPPGRIGENELAKK